MNNKLKIFLTVSFLTLTTIFAPPLAHAGSNLVANGGLEQPLPTDTNLPDAWDKGGWGNNTPVYTYLSPGYSDSRAIKVELTKRSTGDIKWMSANIPVTPSKKYYFADYYTSSITSYIEARILLNTGKYKYVRLATVPASSTWKLAQSTYTTPSTAVSISLYHLIDNVGNLSTDSYYFADTIFTPSPSAPPSPSPSPTLAPSPSPSPIPTPKPTPSPIASLDPSPSPSPTSTPTPNPTESPSPTTSPSVSPTPSPSPIPSPTPSPSLSPSLTPSPSPSPTPTLAPSPSPSPTPTPTPTPINSLIGNPSFEDSTTPVNPNLWFTGNWGTNTSTFTYPVTGFTSERGAKVEISTYVDGDAKWYFEDVPVIPGSTYQFSNRYQSSVGSDLVIRYKPVGSTSYTYQSLGGAPTSASWSMSSASFTVPEGIESITIFHLISSVGWLTVDDYLLTKNQGPIPFTRGMVSLDFDDGWLSTFTNGIPILNAAGYKSTQYIITSLLAGDSYYVSSSQVLQMAAKGHEIGSHSRTHPDLPLLNQTQIIDEVTGAKADLIGIGITPSVIAFPYGTYNSLVDQVVIDSEYLAARTALIADGGYNYKDTDRYHLKTQSVEQSTTIDDIKSMIDNAVQNKTWLILVLHEINDSGSLYSTSSAKLQQIVDYLKQQNVPVVTASQGLSLMSE